MKLGETRSAVVAAAELEAEFRRGQNGVEFERLRRAFLELLGRRGYLVGTPGELAGSMAEILAVGTGFDLYDLAETLAALDATATECRQPTRARHWPELKPFVSRCRCGGHAEGGKP